jgi:hypothetical protein
MYLGLYALADWGLLVCRFTMLKNWGFKEFTRIWEVSESVVASLRLGGVAVRADARPQR